MTSALKETLRSSQIRFLNEAADVGSFGLGHCTFFDLYIAITGLRSARLDAEGDDPPASCGSDSLQNRVLKRSHVGNDVICRQEEQQRVGLFRFLTQDKESRDSGRRPRATPLRLKDDARGADRRALEERRNQEAVLFIADDQRG